MNPLVGIQNPNPLVQGTPNMTFQQGLPQGLMGNVMQPAQYPPSLMNTTPGDWSQVAYQMAGSPKQGGLYPSVTPPTALPGTTGGSTSGGGGSAVGGTVLGLLGALAKNPSLLKSGANAISGLFGSAGLPAGAASAINSSALAGLEPVGTGAVDAAVDSAGADASAALGGGDAGSAGAATSLTGGLLGGAGAASSAGSALGAGAPGVFASGSAAAGSGGATAGAGLGAAGTAAVVAAPFIAQQLGLMAGDAWTAKTTQGDAAMQDWVKATGGKWVQSPASSTYNKFGVSQNQMSGGVDTGYFQMPDGSKLTKAQSANAIYQWATQNGVNPGDYKPG